MAELDPIIQPEEFRADGGPPDWVFFHGLRLLLGWGDGLWETLGDGLSRIRTVFVIHHAAQMALQKELESLFEWIDGYDADRPPMPFYARVLHDKGHACTCAYANDVCKAYAGPPSHALHGPEAYHPIEANENYRVAHGVSEDHLPYLRVEKRAKTLKPEFQDTMAEFGLAHARGVGRRSDPKPAGEKRVRRQRKQAEQAFAAHVEGLKKAYREERYLQLLADPASRPPRFLVAMAEQARLRLEDVARGKNGQDGLPYAPHTGDELLARTAHAIASAEATDLAFDYAWTPVVRFDRRGLVITFDREYLARP